MTRINLSRRKYAISSERSVTPEWLEGEVRAYCVRTGESLESVEEHIAEALSMAAETIAMALDKQHRPTGLVYPDDFDEEVVRETERQRKWIVSKIIGWQFFDGRV